jgi:hypothetical protein
MVRRQREQHVDHLEALGAIGVVDAGHLHQLLVGMLIAQDGQRLDDLVARDGQHDLAMLLARGDQQPQSGRSAWPARPHSRTIWVRHAQQP